MSLKDLIYDDPQKRLSLCGRGYSSLIVALKFHLLVCLLIVFQYNSFYKKTSWNSKNLCDFCRKIDYNQPITLGITLLISTAINLIVKNLHCFCAAEHCVKFLITRPCHALSLIFTFHCIQSFIHSFT